jgi:hypothetical protein
MTFWYGCDLPLHGSGFGISLTLRRMVFPRCSKNGGIDGKAQKNAAKAQLALTGG